MEQRIIKSYKPDLSSDEYNELVREEIYRIDKKIMKLVDKASRGQDKEIDRLQSIFFKNIGLDMFLDSSRCGLDSSDGLVTNDIFKKIDFEKLDFKDCDAKAYRLNLADICKAGAVVVMQLAKKAFNEGNIKETLYNLETVNHYHGFYMGLTGDMEFSSLFKSATTTKAVKSKDEKTMQPIRDFIKKEYLKRDWETIVAATLDLEPLLIEFMEKNKLVRPIPTNRSRWLKDLISKIKNNQEEK